MTNYILGISAYYHDSAAVLLADGKILHAAQEERFTRVKHDPSFPLNAVRYILAGAKIDLKDLEFVVFYDKPFLKLERLLETYHAFAPRGLTSFLSAIPIWIKEKIFTRRLIYQELSKISPVKPPLLFPEHHLSHGASAFFPSPFKEAAILTLDGVGEWATTTLGYGEENRITLLKELDFPHSLGLLYSAFTYYCGFKVNSGEYKLMGLAPYGNPSSEETKGFIQKILDHLVDIREDGSILLNMDYFNYATGLTMCHEKKWQELFGFPKREKETEITSQYMNLALAIQNVTERIILRLAATLAGLTHSRNLVLAGGVALNCVANGKLLKSKIFDRIWIQPAAGDAGGALGAALSAWHIYKGEPRIIQANKDAMNNALLGPEYSVSDIRHTLLKYQAPYEYKENFQELCATVASLLDQGNVIGWFQGRMEFGPRALGSRSILGDARNPEMQKRLNLKIKYREGFRPFAPAVLEEDRGEYFDLDTPSPYMLLVAPVHQKRLNAPPEGYQEMPLLKRLYFQRSDIPAVTHIDFSARIQTVGKEENYRFWRLIQAFKELTGYGVIVNTSFNVRGEPIVNTPEDAYRCFMRTEMDYLVLGDHLLKKDEQPFFADKDNWKETYELD